MHSNLPEGAYAAIVLGELSEETKLGAELMSMAANVEKSLILLETFIATDASNVMTTLYNDLLNRVDDLEGTNE
jgi:hypothetical protein